MVAELMVHGRWRKAGRVLALILLSASVVPSARAETAPPGSPSGLTASRGPGGGQISLSWSPPLSIITPEPTGYRVYRGTAQPVTVTARDDDGSRESSMTLDYTDDKAVKRLIVPGDGLDFATSAQLWVIGRATNCNYRSNAQRLLVNGSIILEFDRCAVFPTSGFEARAFSVPLSRITAGATNSFEIRVSSSGNWNYSTQFGLDQTNDLGRSDVNQNGGDLAGELMWYLDIHRIAPQGDAGPILTTTATAAVDQGLAAGAHRYYYVTALNQEAESTASNQAVARTFDATGAPRSLTGAPGPGLGEASLSWLAPATSSEPQASSYRVYRSGTLVTQTTSTSFRDVGLGHGAPAPYTVSSVNVAGESTSSASVTVTTYSDSVPGTPGQVAATGRGGRVDLSWSAPVPGQSQPARRYRIYRGPAAAGVATGPATFVTETASTAASDTGLAPAASFYYRVSAANDAGEGAPSAEVFATTFALPGAPVGLTASPDHCSRRTKLEWSPPGATGGGAITGYKIFRGPSPSSTSLHATTSGPATTYSDPGDLGAGYHYRISALTSGGEGPVSEAVFMSIPDWGCFSFNSSDEGFVRETQQPGSEVGHLPGAGWVQLVSQRTDPGHEVYTRGLGSTFSTASSFTVAATWAVNHSGALQGAVPLAVSGWSGLDFASAPSTLFVYYSGGDPYGGIRPSYSLRYRDAAGVLRIDAPFVEVPGSFPGYGIAYNSFVHRLTLEYRAGAIKARVTSSSGAVIAAASYQVGQPGPADGFAFDKVGMSSRGTRGVADQPLVGYVDDVSVWYHSAAPTPARQVAAASDPGSSSVSLDWLAPSYDGGAAIVRYRIYRTGASGGEVLAGESAGTSFSDAGLAPGAYTYRIGAVSSLGEGHRSEPVKVLVL